MQTMQTKTRSLGLKEIKHELKPTLEKAHQRYKEASKDNQVIAELAEIAARMFEDSWQVLEERWEDLRALGIHREDTLAHLDKQTKFKWENVLLESQKKAKLFLESQGNSNLPLSTLYEMLASCYPEEGVKDILRRVCDKLAKMTINYQNKQTGESKLIKVRRTRDLEGGQYGRFEEFFGRPHDQVRKWKKSDQERKR